ncbi:MAG: beta-ketoacyl-[acyl-carrier-protein] synthase family protein [Nitrospirota bacterium]
MERIVITGIGLITPIGIGKEAFWANALKGISGIREISSFDTARFSSHKGAEVREFNPSDFISSSNERKMDRLSHIAVAGARLALEDAGLKEFSWQDRAGVVIGTAYGSLKSTSQYLNGLVDYGPSRANPFIFPNTVSNAPASYIAIELEIKGPNVTVVHKQSSAEQAIFYGYNLLRRKKADIIITGGCDEICWILYQVHDILNVLATGSEQSCPYDRRRNGIILGEGAGFLILERMEDAVKRNARMYAEIAGFGFYGTHAPLLGWDEEPTGLCKAMEGAIKNGGLVPEDIDYISASADSSSLLDALESKAVKSVFGNSHPPASSIKSMIGEIGASGGIKVAVASLSVKEGIIPPTINYKDPDPECDIDCVPNESRRKNIEAALVNGFSTGGNHLCITLKKVNCERF